MSISRNLAAVTLRWTAAVLNRETMVLTYLLHANQNLLVVMIDLLIR